MPLDNDSKPLRGVMTLVIGDIHGCNDELQALLDLAGIADDEPIIALGDLFDKGNQPQAVFDFFRQHPQATSLCGNHDYKHLQARHTQKTPPLEQLLTRWHLGDQYDDLLHFIATFPLYIELDEALLVHAYYDPTVPLSQQGSAILMGLDKGKQALIDKLDQAWFTQLTLNKPLIVGHKDYSILQKPFIIEGCFYGIDTQCVVGGHLTAIRLPQWEIISVPAKKNYWEKISKRYAP